MWEFIQIEFFRNALLTGLLVSVLCGLIGSLVVTNRIVFLAGGIAHSAYGGVGLALFFGLPFFITTLGYTAISAWIMAIVALKVGGWRVDAVIGALWAVGMALGVMLVDLTPGYNVDMMSFLFGNILTVHRGDLVIIGIVSALLVMTIWFFYHGLVAVSFDREFASIRGIAVNKLYFLLISAIAISIVLSMRVVGLILVLSLLTLPPLIVERYSRSLWEMMLKATLLCALITISGLLLAFFFDLACGATIVMVAGMVFLLSELAGYVWSKYCNRYPAKLRETGLNR